MYASKAAPARHCDLELPETEVNTEEPEKETVHHSPEHPNTATSLNNLAGLLESEGDYAAAKPLYERALAIIEKALGADHPNTSTNLNNLAYLLAAQGDYAAAEPLY